jgi:hypothetical protein
MGDVDHHLAARDGGAGRKDRRELSIESPLGALDAALEGRGLVHRVQIGIRWEVVHVQHVERGPRARRDRPRRAEHLAGDFRQIGGSENGADRERFHDA